MDRQNAPVHTDLRLCYRLGNSSGRMSDCEAWVKWSSISTHASELEQTIQKLRSELALASKQCEIKERELVYTAETLLQLQAVADKLAEALTNEAVKRCRLCSNYNGPGAYRRVYEHVPTRGTDGRFFHQRHDGVTDGAWLCESQDIQAALAQYAEMKSDKLASQGGRE